MASVVKLKRGSGSNPQASDLVVGELAVRTDTALLFTKNDAGNVVPIGISDGDKGDITVSSSGATFTIDNDAVTYAKIQNVSATNRILGRDSSGAGVIEEITPANLRTMINVEDGATADQTNSEIASALSDQRPSMKGADFTDDGTGSPIVHIKGDDGNPWGLIIGNDTYSTSSHGFAIYVDNNGDIDSRSRGNSEYRTWNIKQDNGSTVRDLITLSNDGSVYLRHQGNLKLGTSSSGVSVTGDLVVSDDLTVTDDLFMFDSGKIKMGHGEDLKIYHDGSNSIIEDSGTGSLLIQGSRVDLLNAAGDEIMLAALQNGAVSLYYDNAKKFETTSDGIKVTDLVTDGEVNIMGSSDGNKYLDARVGSDSLQIRATSGGDSNHETMAKFFGNGGVELYHDASKKFETTSDGASVTGHLKSYHLKPMANNTYDVGTTSLKWRDVYATNFHGDGSNLTGISAGATGGGSDECFYENSQNITTNYTITNGKNAMSAGPITVDSGVTVTVGSGETWTVV